MSVKYNVKMYKVRMFYFKFFYAFFSLVRITNTSKHTSIFPIKKSKNSL